MTNISGGHHKHCSSWTVTTSGDRKPCDCICAKFTARTPSEASTEQAELQLEQMTDDALRAACEFHRNKAQEYSNELAKVWRLRVRTGIATEEDEQRQATLVNTRTVSPTAEPLCPPHSPSGKFWHAWFSRMGDKATVDVVNTTATLVIEEERKLALTAERIKALEDAAKLIERKGETSPDSKIRVACVFLASDVRALISSTPASAAPID